MVSLSLKSAAANLGWREILFIACLSSGKDTIFLSPSQAKMMLHRLATTAASRTVRSAVRPRMLSTATTAARGQHAARNSSAFLLTAAAITTLAATIDENQRHRLRDVPALCHCQVPCGIFDDPVRVKLLEEHAATIRKAVVQVRPSCLCSLCIDVPTLDSSMRSKILLNYFGCMTINDHLWVLLLFYILSLDQQPRWRVTRTAGLQPGGTVGSCQGRRGVTNHRCRVDVHAVPARQEGQFCLP